ncbi:hypothetical protein [[Scytonema hofmanni] UTEX B 1581]|uniref:hypothetical protein n=1 Tax=[Scytonema hofmanni] UTEX B 1581 TaxID=379535 RepID=UPI0004980143|nr:hypothetical protein [[Scytonema hofmanni] UTEX B 1581]
MKRYTSCCLYQASAFVVFSKKRGQYCSIGFDITSKPKFFILQDVVIGVCPDRMGSTSGLTKLLVQAVEDNLLVVSFFGDEFLVLAR